MRNREWWGSSRGFLPWRAGRLWPRFVSDEATAQANVTVIEDGRLPRRHAVGRLAQFDCGRTVRAGADGGGDGRGLVANLDRGGDGAVGRAADPVDLRGRQALVAQGRARADDEGVAGAVLADDKQRLGGGDA